MISLNLVLAGLRLGLKNRQVSEKWVADDCSYLCKGLTVYQGNNILTVVNFNQLATKGENNVRITT
ncbi:hypothetical protein [uncultured Gammaproteobacteria bacterium]|nr:hypothetical protein [uncultured Gammaproteobacteria bacterium]